MTHTAADAQAYALAQGMSDGDAREFGDWVICTQDLGDTLSLLWHSWQQAGLDEALDL